MHLLLCKHNRPDYSIFNPHYLELSKIWLWHTQNTCINRKCGTQYSLPLEISWTRNRGYMKNHYSLFKSSLEAQGKATV